MANLSNLLGGEFRAKKEVEIASDPLDQAKESIINHGMKPPEQLVADGKIRRFDDKKGDKACWYVLYNEGFVCGSFGNWRTGETVNFKAALDRELTSWEIMAIEKRMAEAREQAKKEKEQLNQVTSEGANTIWSGATAASDNHPYLVKKGIKANGLRVSGDGRLIVPAYDQNGEISTLQFISDDGSKQFLSGGKTKGACWYIGTPDENKKTFVAEGFATAASIYESTGHCTVIAFNANNLVAGAVLASQLSSEVCIVADNDESKTGENKANEAAQITGCEVILIPELGDANDYALAGNDLGALLLPVVDDFLISADDFVSQQINVEWLIKGFIQKAALTMIHGPSGSGKTFVVLDMCHHIASSLSWCGNKTRQGKVVYLAGEGHQGLRARIAAWRKKHGISSLDMMISRSGTDLNTAAGYTKVRNSIKALDEKPALIVVDTLHRFLDGDENSAKDAKTMLDACAALTNEFGSAVILVHHTGVSEDAQGRARGSSAWRGALDIEFNVKNEDGQVQLIQKKNKDGELQQPRVFEFEKVSLDWVDEDGDTISSLIINETSAAPVIEKQTRETKLQSEDRQEFEGAFSMFGEIDGDGDLYLTMSAFKEYFKRTGVEKESSQRMKAKRITGRLCEKHYLKSKNDGFIVVDALAISALSLAMN